MSFILNSTSNRFPRRGLLSLNNFQYETPLILQYSRNGSIPHLDWNLCQRYLNDSNAPLLIPLPTCIGMVSYLRSLEVEMRKFCCIPDSRATFISIFDPCKPSPSGYNYKDEFSVWTPGGREKITTKHFVEAISLLKPDGYQSLCDSDTPINASKKRISNSLRKTLNALKVCLDSRDETSPPLFGSIEGGSDMASRMIAVKGTREQMVDGFVLEGIGNNFMERDQLCDLIRAVVSEIPQDKPRAVFGSLRPEEIHFLINVGFDLFDSSYATLLAECGQVLMIDFQESITKSFTIDLKEGKFKTDFSIISKDCACYSCVEGFTKGYINHLLNCKEMTATVLLMLHNLHVLYEWLHKLKSCQ